MHACAKGRRSPFSEEATLSIPVSPTAGRKVTVGYAAGLELTAAWKGITSSTECQMPGLICVCFYHPQKIATLQILPALSWAFKWSLNKYTNKSIDFTELKLKLRNLPLVALGSKPSCVGHRRELSQCPLLPLLNEGVSSVPTRKTLEWKMSKKK